MRINVKNVLKNGELKMNKDCCLKTNRDNNKKRIRAVNLLPKQTLFTAHCDLVTISLLFVLCYLLFASCDNLESDIDVIMEKMACNGEWTVITQATEILPVGQESRKCKDCGKTFKSNVEKDYCFDCEKKHRKT